MRSLIIFCILFSCENEKETSFLDQCPTAQAVIMAIEELSSKHSTCAELGVCLGLKTRVTNELSLAAEYYKTYRLPQNSYSVTKFKCVISDNTILDLSDVHVALDICRLKK